MVTVRKPTDLPKDAKYLVIEFETTSIHHAADQRSIDFPGHGYGAYTENIDSNKIHVFLNEEDLKEFFKRNIKQKTDYAKYLVYELGRKVTVTEQISINLD